MLHQPFFFFFGKLHSGKSRVARVTRREGWSANPSFFFVSCEIMLSLFMIMFLFQGQEGPSPVIPGPRGQRVICDNQHKYWLMNWLDLDFQQLCLLVGWSWSAGYSWNKRNQTLCWRTQRTEGLSACMPACLSACLFVLGHWPFLILYFRENQVKLEWKVVVD